MATLTWTNAAGGSWDTPGDWNTGTLPAAGDDVVINAITGGATLTIAAIDMSLAHHRGAGDTR